MPAVKLQLDPATVENVIEHLDQVCLRPGMYFSNLTLFQATDFLTGFRVAVDATFDAKTLQECRRKVAAARGYKTRSHWHHDFQEQIRERIPEEADRAVELLNLELEAWKQLQELTH